MSGQALPFWESVSHRNNVCSSTAARASQVAWTSGRVAVQRVQHFLCQKRRSTGGVQPFTLDTHTALVKLELLSVMRLYSLVCGAHSQVRICQT